MSTQATPQDRLMAQLQTRGGRLFIIAAVLIVWLVDYALSHRLVDNGGITGSPREAMRIFENVSTVAFIVVSVALIVAVLTRAHKWMPWLVLVYLGFSIVQVIVNVGSLLATAHLQQSGSGLTGLWDVGAVYLMSVMVFTFVYAALDLTVKGGAFVWPARDGQEAPTPNFIDYLFIALNTNSTYGPTSEVVMSRRTKLLMALQVILAIVMLAVLIARSVVATG
ncbi:MAG: hypothetical protein ACKORG_00140 [Actinomycetota bacterium]